MVQFVAVVGVLGHQETAVHPLLFQKTENDDGFLKNPKNDLERIFCLVLWRACRILRRVRVVLGAEAVHHLVHQVEHAHAQGDAVLLGALQADEESVEAVRVLVGLDADAALADAADAVGFGVAAPGETCSRK